jgi:hypothetical protein
MSDNESLIADITKARAWVKQTRRSWENSKFQMKEAKEIYDGAVSALDELVGELTGENKRPLMAKIDEAKEAIDPRPWREWSLGEVFGLLDDADEHREEDVGLVKEMEEELEIDADTEDATLENLSQWLQVNELGTFVDKGILDAGQVGRLRAALLRAKEKFGWPDSIDEDDQGIPLAAIREPDEVQDASADGPHTIEDAAESARLVFGDGRSDTDSERLLAALRATSDGLTRKQISVEVFNRHKKSAEIASLLSELLTQGMAHRKADSSSGGRPAERWHAGKELAS